MFICKPISWESLYFHTCLFAHLFAYPRQLHNHNTKCVLRLHFSVQTKRHTPGYYLRPDVSVIVLYQFAYSSVSFFRFLFHFFPIWQPYYSRAWFQLGRRKSHCQLSLKSPNENHPSKTGRLIGAAAEKILWLPSSNQVQQWLSVSANAPTPPYPEMWIQQHVYSRLIAFSLYLSP